MVVYDKYYVKNKEEPQYIKKEKNTYCLVCKKKTDNKKVRRVALENKIGQQKSTCVDCGPKKSTFSKPIKPLKKQK